MKCVPKEKPALKITFVKDAMKEVAVIAVNEKLVKELGEPMEMSITPIKVKNSKRKKKVGKHKKTSTKKGD